MGGGGGGGGGVAKYASCFGGGGGGGTVIRYHACQYASHSCNYLSNCFVRRKILSSICMQVYMSVPANLHVMKSLSCAPTDII